jgi:hypothetical protein
LNIRTLAHGTEQVSQTTPALSLFLAYAAMVPIIAAAAAGWLTPASGLISITRFAMLYGAALLCFFAGVRRGLSFRQSGGPAPAQIAGMVWLYGLGVLTAITAPYPAAMLLPLIGFLSLIPLDSRAAANAEAPLYFGRLRRVQMWFPSLSLAALLARHLTV